MRLSASLARSCARIILWGPLLVAGCGGSSLNPGQARGRVAAEAAGGALPGAALARWLIRSPVAPSPVVAAGLVSAWINTAVLVDAIRRNVVLDDSATVDAVILPDAQRGMITQFFQARDARRRPITDAEADSLFDADQVRVFQQIVLRVNGKPDSATASRIVARARGLLARLHDGVDFATVVKQASEDTVSRAHAGFIPAMSRDQLPQWFASLWDLRPKEISDLLGSPIGAHIFRRATREESRDPLKGWLAPRLARRADSLFVDSVARSRHLVVAAGGRDRMRSMAIEPGRLADGPPLVTWNGGSLTAADVLSAELMLQPKDRAALSNASDTVATQYLLGLARVRIMVPLASDEAAPSAAARRALAPVYRRALDSLRAEVRRLPPGASAADAATAFIDSILAGRARYLPLPGALTGILRARGGVTVNQPVLDALVRGAAAGWQEAHPNDARARDQGSPADSSLVPRTP